MSMATTAAPDLSLDRRNDRYLRQLDIANPEKFRYPVTILGVGALGSMAAMAVSKLGNPRGLSIIDYDTFDSHNISNQLSFEGWAGTNDKAGRYKAEAIAQVCRDMGGLGEITSYVAKLDGAKLVFPADGSEVAAKPRVKGIVISTPDSMAARKMLWNLCMMNAETPYIIDARSAGAGQYLQVLCYNSMDFAYGATIIDDKEATPEPCSARGIIFTSMMAGAIIGNLVKRLQLGESTFRELRLDQSTMQMDITLPSGARVSNGEALALAMAS